MIKQCTLLSILIFLLTSCGEEQPVEVEEMVAPMKVMPKGFTQKIVKNQYSIYIPNYLQETTSLSEDASFQAVNAAKEIYTVVIDEPIDDFVEYYWDLGIYDHSKTELQNYRESQLAYFVKSGELIKKGEIIEKSFGDKYGELTYVISKVDDVDIYYAIGFVQGKDTFYYIFAWTLNEQQDAYRQDLFNIIKSFREE